MIIVEEGDEYDNCSILTFNLNSPDKIDFGLCSLNGAASSNETDEQSPNFGREVKDLLQAIKV